MRRDGGLRRRLLVGLGTLTVLFLAVLGTMLFAIHELRATDTAAQRTADVVVPTSRAQARLTRLETALRERVADPTPETERELDAAIVDFGAALDRVDRAVDAADGANSEVAEAIRREIDGARSFLTTIAVPLRDNPPASTADASALRAEAVAERIGIDLNQLVERGRARLLPRREETADLARLAEIVGVAGIGLTLVLLGGCLFYFRRSVLDPMRNVAAAARAISEGDFQARVRGDDAVGSGEVASLAQTFNRMAASLEESRGALQRQNAELESRGAELVDAVRSAREGASVLRAVLDATPDAIALLDREGAPIVDNPPMRAVRAAFGARATAIDQDGTLVPLDAGDGSGEVRDEITLLGTRRAFARYATPVRDGHGRLIGRLLVLREVTREREAERVKEEFFALVSHELRTPLTAILGYVELVLGEHAEAGTDADEERRHLEIVERNAQRLLRLVGDLLFAAQVESDSLLLEPGIVDLSQIAHEAVEAARPRAEDAGILLSAQIDPLPAAVGDRDRLAQVLDNLISNALKFTPSGGHVEVRLSRAGDEARLDVADTGVGVPRNEQSRLFDRFFRASNATARAVPGVGLGLMIVHAIVSAHGGTISLASEIGEGSTFTVRLPLQPAEAHDRDAAGGAGGLGGLTRGAYSAGGR